MPRLDVQGTAAKDPNYEPLIALVGQPNCGKSTLFNALAGFKSNTGNFPGTSVAITQSRVAFAGLHARIVDLPGTYSLTPRDGAEEVTRRFLSDHTADVVIGNGRLLDGQTGLDQRNIDDLALAGEGAAVQRGQCALGGEHAGQGVAE